MINNAARSNRTMPCDLRPESDSRRVIEVDKAAVPKRTGPQLYANDAEDEEDEEAEDQNVDQHRQSVE